MSEWDYLNMWCSININLFWNIGGINGNISVWELPEITEYDEDLIPKFKIQLSKDCINGISLHKTLPILATSSGQRQCDIETKNRDNSVRFWWIGWEECSILHVYVCMYNQNSRVNI